MQKNDSHSGKEKVELEGMRLENGDLWKKVKYQPGMIWRGLEQNSNKYKYAFQLGVCISTVSKVKVKMKVTQSYLTLRPHGLYSPWILQARILEWIAFPFSGGSSQPRDQTDVSCIAGGFFTN